MRLELFDKQDKFAKAALSGEFKYLLYGGAVGGGKTVTVLSLVILLAKMFPGSRWAVVRADLPRLKRTTIPSFERIKPTNFVGPINRTEWTARCANGSEILFFPETLKSDPELHRWLGLEVNGFAIDQVEELSEAAWNKCIERAGRWKCRRAQPPILIMATCNPTRSYPKRLWYDPWRAGTLKAPYFFMPSGPHDNPHNSEDYLSSLENLPDREKERFVKGNWDASDEPDQLIKFEWVLSAREVEPDEGKKGLGVDVARYGDDDTVLAYRRGNCLTHIERHHGLSIDRIASIVCNVAAEAAIDANRINVDGVGLGAGVIDNCHKVGLRVNDLQSAAKPIQRKGDSHFRFKNLRSQIWWEFREALRNGQISIDIDDGKLIEDLTAVRYSVDADKMVTVESKDSIKRRIGRSPDTGDACVYAFADLEQASVLDWQVSDAGVRQRPSAF